MTAKTMKTLTIRITEPAFDALEKIAADNYETTTGYAARLIVDAVKPGGRLHPHDPDYDL